MGNQLPSPKRGQTQFSAHLLWPNVWMDQDATGTEQGLGQDDIVLNGNPALLPKRGTAPIFGPYLLRPNGCMDQDVTWCGVRPRPMRLCVRRGARCPLLKGGGRTPKFSAHFYCDQTAGWMKLVLGIVVGLSPGEFVLTSTSTSTT